MKIRTLTQAIKNWVSFPYREKRINQRLTKLEALVEVGVDIHMVSDSWVVICIGGKAEYISFYSLGPNGNQGDFHALRNMLRDMRKERVIIDAIPGFSNYLKQDIWG